MCFKPWLHSGKQCPHTPGDFLPDFGSGSGPVSSSQPGPLAEPLLWDWVVLPTDDAPKQTHSPKPEDLCCRFRGGLPFIPTPAKWSPEGKYQNIRTSGGKLKIKTHSGRLTQGREGRPTWSRVEGGCPLPARPAEPGTATRGREWPGCCRDQHGCGPRGGDRHQRPSL